MTHNERTLIKRALRQRWPIPDVARKAAIAECRAVLANGNAPTREKLSAAKILIMADRLNLEQEKHAEPPPPPPSPSVTVNVGLDLSTYAESFRTFAAHVLGGSTGALLPDGREQPLDTPPGD